MSKTRNDEIVLVSLEQEKEKFGIVEIICASLFASAIGLVNFFQRRNLFIKDGVFTPPPDWDTIVSLQFALGASIFFITAATLFFLSYESSKISQFIEGVTRQIIFFYIISLGLIIVVSHIDAFVMDKTIIIIASHSMLFIVGVAETSIDMKIAYSFGNISSHFKELADIFRTARKLAIGILILNLLFTLAEILKELGFDKYSFLKASNFTLGIIVLLDFIILLWVRFKIKNIHISEEKKEEDIEG